MAPSKNQERDAREARDRLKAYNARQAVHTHQVRRRRRDNLIAAIGVVAIAALATVTQVFYFSSGPGAPTPAPSSSASAEAGANVGAVPDISVAENRTWTGEMTINGIPLGFELDGAAAPQATAAFVTDIQSGYLTDKTCHRLVSEASAGLLQCGSADGKGGSDPTYSYGPIENAPTDGIYKTASLAIARGDGAYSNGHQFFIVFSDSTLADPVGYTVVGTITSGLDALVTGVADGGIQGGATDGPPVIPTKIDSVTIQ